MTISPRKLRGALVVVGPETGEPRNVIAFQYNPDTLSRSLQPPEGEGGERSQTPRARSAPVETVKLEVEIDATDRLATAGSRAADVMRYGIHPQLAALELLLYPELAEVIANEALLAAGELEIVPPFAPLVLFVWGRNRVQPVRITELAVGEEAHDPNLNPIRAKVSLSLRVLTYDDLPASHRGHGLFLAHQSVKQVLAMPVRSTDLTAVLGERDFRFTSIPTGR